MSVTVRSLSYPVGVDKPHVQLKDGVWYAWQIVPPKPAIGLRKGWNESKRYRVGEGSTHIEALRRFASNPTYETVR